MDEKELRSVASQLSCPEGEFGLSVGNKMNVLNQFITNKTIEALSAKQGESIIEVGPGNGFLSIPLLDVLGKEGHYFGVEMSELMAAEASRILSDKKCTVKILNGSCSEVNVMPSSIDGVIAINVLYFIEDLITFFKQLLSWMKLGGRVAFGIRSDKALNNLPFTQYGFNVRSTDEVEMLMDQAGFVSIESSVYDEGMTPFGDIDIPVDSVIIVGKKLEI
jgi:ubiquinone/menaquinone biosynthesis C-methylase UbiE